MNGSRRVTTSSSQEEHLYVGTADAEHVEIYLKALWYLAERREDLRIRHISKLLAVSPPSVVQMLKKLDRIGLLNYTNGRVRVTPEGEHIGKQMMRNTRLLEVLMKDALKIELDEEMVCGIEHHMKDIFTDALCTLLNHPRKCPHGHDIPLGRCCPSQ